jgi:hypothetical protein
MTVLRGATREQRWNAALAVLLSVLLLLFGWPSSRDEADAVVAGADQAPSTAPVPMPTSTPGLDRLPLEPPVAAPARPSPGVSLTPPPLQALRVAAVVAAPVSGAPSEAAVAHELVPSATLVDATTDLCHVLPQRADLVLAAHDLSAAVRACLQRARVTVLAFDSAGSAGSLFSLRRSLFDSLLDQGPLLTGRVGVVGESGSAETVRRAVERLRSAGHDVVATTLLHAGADADTAGVVQGVADFAVARVETVLFAVSVANQSTWVQTSLLPQRFVVADAADAIVDEAYPDAFDGGLSRTTTKGAWFSRAHGSSALERSCRETVARLAPDGTTAVRWCALAQAAHRLRSPRAAGMSVASQLQRLTLTTPTSSDVGAHGTSWGPYAVAEVAWHKDCGCFRESVPFQGPMR